MNKGRKKKNTDKEIETALRKHRGLITYAARELNCHYETIIKRTKASKKLQKVMQEIHESRGDSVENIIIINLDLAERKAKKLSKDLKDIDDKGITKLAIDKDGVEAALKVARMKLKDRGYVERQEVTGADGSPLTVNLIDYKNAKK